MKKIRSEYCTEDKVQVMLSNAPSQIIFSPDDIICFKENGKKLIYTYEEDLSKNVLPYCDIPETKMHLNHLFDYDKPYVQFTSDPIIGFSLRLSDGYSLDVFTFNKSLLGAELRELSLQKHGLKEICMVTDAEGVIKFLRKQPEEDAKYILDQSDGILYVDTEAYGNLVDRYNVVLDDNEILKKYIFMKFTLFGNFDGERPQNISQVPPHIISSDLFCEPIMFISKDGKLFYTEFDIRFLKSNEFLIESYQKEIVVPRLYNSGVKEYIEDPHYLDCISEYPISSFSESVQMSNSQRFKSKIFSLF